MGRGRLAHAGARRRAGVDEVEPPARIEGTARLGRTRAVVRWELRPESRGTRVHLAARVLAAGPIDRLLLAAGGRAWLRRRFTVTLSRESRPIRLHWRRNVADRRNIASTIA